VVGTVASNVVHCYNHGVRDFFFHREWKHFAAFFLSKKNCGSEIALVFRAHLHYFLADSFYNAILRAIHICATIGRHCPFFSAHFLRSKCYPYLQEHTFESHRIFQATDPNELFVTMEGTVIFTSVTKSTLTVMSLLSFMASAQKKIDLQFKFTYIYSHLWRAPCTSVEGETGILKT